MHLQRSRRDKASISHDQLGPGHLVILQMRVDLALDHFALALDNGRHIGCDGAGHHAEVRAVTRQMRDLRIPNLVLAGQTGELGQEPPIQRRSTTVVRRPDCAVC